MSKTLNAKELKEQASLVELLGQLGYHPKRKSGKEQMYRSMLRDDDHTPSFAVDNKSGEWYDHGLGIGGNIIDFGLKYWPNDTFKEVIQKINTILSSSLPMINSQTKLSPRSKKEPKEPSYTITAIKALGTHPAITEYLKSRGVFEIGLPLLNEIYYTVQGENKELKLFYSAGWKNENGSWEVRNRYFKGCLGTKGLTTIPGSPKMVSVFEGFINYLSWKNANQNSERTIIVLNTLSFLAEGISRLKQFTDIDIFFDRDAGGHKASKELLIALPYATDRSITYDGFNDYNDKLVADLKAGISVQSEESRISSSQRR